LLRRVAGSILEVPVNVLSRPAQRGIDLPDAGLLPEGIVAIVKRDCPTCQMVAPVLAQLGAAGVPLTVYSQDDLAFPPGVPVVDDTALDVSFRLQIETVPTVLRVAGGEVIERTEGWARERWERLTRVSGLGNGLPQFRPGCGSRTLEPEIADRLAVRDGALRLRSRRIAIG